MEKRKLQAGQQEESQGQYEGHNSKRTVRGTCTFKVSKTDVMQKGHTLFRKYLRYWNNTFRIA